MKLLEMTYGELMKAMPKIIAEIEPLLEDDEVMELLGGSGRSEGEDHIAYRRRMGKNMLTFLSLMSGKHRAMLNRIFGIILGCTQEELEEKGIRDLLKINSTVSNEEAW